MTENRSSHKTKTNIIMIASVVIGVTLGVILAQSNLVSGSMGNMLVFFSIVCLILVGFLSFAGYVVVSSAKKTPKAPQTEDREAKKFIPAVDRGVVYIFRDQFIAMAKAFPIMLSKEQVGYIKGRTFLRLELSAGQYTFGGDKSCKEGLTFSIVNGQILFVEQEIVAGALKGGYAYHILNDGPETRTRVTRCRLLLQSK